MLKMFNIENENQFTWDAIGNISEGRKNLGEDMPVLVYRLLQFTLKDELVKQFGNKKTIEIFRNAGELAGKEFAEHVLDLTLSLDDFIPHLQDVLKDNKIGILRIEKFDIETGTAMLTVGEDLDCSGLPITGETVCNYDEGFLAGILKVYTKKNYIVTEVDCWATGSRVCRFEAIVKDVSGD
ncbi:MAG: V4R domain-containing protein [Lachnospiraceae bacterium]